MTFWQKIIFAIVLLVGASMVISSAGEAVHGTPQREGFVRSIVRAAAHWLVDRSLKEAPTVEDAPEQVEHEPQTVMSIGPIKEPSKFLAMPGKPLDHGDGW